MIRALPLAALLLISACSLPGEPATAPTRYGLAAISDSPAASSPALGTLQLARPLAANGLDSERIQVERPGGSLTYAEGAAWVEPLPDLLQSSLRTALERRGVAGHVIDTRTGAQADALLYVTLERFTIVYADSLNAAPAIEVRASLQLVNEPQGRIAKTLPVSFTLPASGNRMADIMRSFDAAAARLADESASLAGTPPAPAAPTPAAPALTPAH